MFSISQTIKAPDSIHFFGVSIALFGKHLAVSSTKGDEQNIIFTYNVDETETTFVENGQLEVPGASGAVYYGFITITWGTMVVTVTDKENNPEVCAYVYDLGHGRKTGKVESNNNTNDKDNYSNIIYRWDHIATLKTKGEPLKSDYQSHASVVIGNGKVFTGRVNAFGEEKGVVFVHDLP